ncbi:16S rRNA (guanine(527)-N(7))-methyltransferase RsmG [Amycolatopsis acidiphila]|uniref:Ribosomal RNA small subunit methyltransferase G n=1 Tax=Amycolatopsis acidiphila TaxID=715473 RepID=A0A558A2B3_9PSEU|nr:16S rRNA (guanine(527)-N(7))-methyltransferase RsmG [Amycolatopsis acidiphila]TVT18392.1 16S rRNA (guanine(527)-N(7))-methyltransferase RsmG [Amycolatopsis acidiphila]UIJ60128.1 16S rRNA (guanine(527)-N(7))-methyltransferase RsmG [Amycolatopsis acidiphila]GHG61214.1 ribosomal RNA small subunit methyltransferase G [Amycolatopsis acidiphila]
MGNVESSAAEVFGVGLARAERFAELLEQHGVERGLIGPREVDRLWERHLLNSAVIGERIPEGVRVVDVGSGAGLPGIPLAIARPDLEITLVEPMARRVDWLSEVIEELDLDVRVLRGRAEEKVVRAEIGTVDVVTARAVAPLARLAGWCLPLLREGGMMLALKGASARDEVARDATAVARVGGGTPTVSECGVGLVEVPTTVVIVERIRPQASAQGKRRRNAVGVRSKRTG